MSKTTSNRSYRDSSSFKMAVLFTGLLGGAAVLLVYAIFDLNEKAYSHKAMASIEAELDLLLFAITSHAELDAKTLVQQWIRQQDGVLLGLIDQQHQLIVGNFSFAPDTVFSAAHNGLTQSLVLIDGNPKQVIAKAHIFKNGDQLVVGRDITQVDQARSTINYLSVLILFFMLLVILTSFFISRFVVRRINDIASTAFDIMETGDLSRRIQLKFTWDDLGHLANILNLFLSRIENLMCAVRDVADNIAHDMRTPLTRLRAHLEALSVRVQRGEKPKTEDITALLDESDSILSLFSALLRLSNLEKGKRHQAFQKVHLDQLLRDVVEFYLPLAEENEVSVCVGSIAPYARLGDRDLLFQVFANLMDNAIKFTPSGGRITVNLKAHPKGAEISIADTGIGISTEEVSKVFDRFYRSEKSRHTSGSGLGLSLVAVGIRLHGGQIQLCDNKPGLNCIINL